MFRTGNHWTDQTIIWEGVGEPDGAGRRPDDRLIATVDSAAPEGLAGHIVKLLNDDALFRSAVPAESLQGRLRDLFS